MNARRLLPLLFLALSLCACAAPRNNVVLLLPDPDGHVGHVEVRNAAGAAQLDKAGDAVRIPGPGIAPTAPAALAPEERERLFGAAERALPERPARFVQYFESDSTRLTRESQALLAEVLATARRRDSRDVSVVGHASRQGDEALNIALSRRRAEHVRDLLVKAGLEPYSLEVTSHGSANPLVQSRRHNEPRNRRVEVTVR